MIHVVGLPHTGFDEFKFSACAFTAKAVRLTRMFDMAGIDYRVYWGDTMFTNWEQEAYFGTPKAVALNPAIVGWDANLPYWKSFNERCISLIKQSIQGDDIVAIIGGGVQQCVVDAFVNDFTVIEPGVGYEGVCTGTYACFESYAWKHHRYGKYDINDGRAYDVVIPNAIDPDQFELGDSKGYLLFVGRLIKRKGVEVAGLVAEKLGMPLIVAGAGGVRYTEGIQCDDGSWIKCPNLTYAGVVNPEQRKFLFAHAEAFICPTLYIEPWGGVHVESMASGVGVAAPDWGVFTETIPEDQRYNVLSEACSAVRVARTRRGPNLREETLAKYSMEACAARYADWIDKVTGLRSGRDWYSY